MLLVLPLLLLILFDTTVNSNPIDNSFDCLVNYLREKNLDDEVFNKTAYATGSLTDACNRRITSEIGSVFIDAHMKYEDKKEFKKQIDCFIDSIKNDEKFKNYLLKRKAIESIKLSWKAKLNPKNWIAGKKKEALKAIESDINAIEFENLFVCEYQKTFEGVFESISEVEKLRERNANEENCVKKQLNLTNDATENELNCDEILKDSKTEIFTNLKELYSSHKKSVRKCIDESLNSNNFAAPVFKVRLFMLSSDQKDIEIEKKNFVENMMNLMRKALIKCVKK